MSNERIDLTQFEGIGEWEVLEYWDEDEARYEIRTGRDNHSKHEAEVIAKLPTLIAELKRCYGVMNEVILRAMDAREGEASDIIKHGDEEYVNVVEITYPFSNSDIDSAHNSKASE